MESYKSTEALEGNESVKDMLNLLAEKFSGLVKEQVVIEEVDGTYEIDNNSFTLTFTLDDTLFEIRLIDVHASQGLGTEILTIIHDVADENNLEVVASNVVDGAEGFWEKNGYEEAAEEGIFYRN